MAAILFFQIVPEEETPEEVSPVESKEEAAPAPTEPAGEAPRFTTELTAVTTAHGQPVKLTCVVVGIPRPTVRWILDGEPILETSTTYVTEYHKDGTCVLSIKETLPEDEGEYTLEATNDFGIARTTAELTVIGMFRLVWAKFGVF